MVAPTIKRYYCMAQSENNKGNFINAQFGQNWIQMIGVNSIGVGEKETTEVFMKKEDAIDFANAILAHYGVK